MITHLYIYIYPSQRIFILELYVYQDNIRTLVHFVTFKFLLFHILLIEIICMEILRFTFLIALLYNEMKKVLQFLLVY